MAEDSQEPVLKKLKTATSGPSSEVPPSSSSSPQRKDASGEVAVASTPLISSTVSHRGMKNYQQDMCVTIREEEVTTLAPALNDTRYAFFAVYDGHGGDFCSKYLQSNFHINLFGALTKALGALRNQSKELTKAMEKQTKKSLRKDAFQKTLIDCCKTTDQALLKLCVEEKHEDGSCAVAALVEGDVVHIANVGDSRAVLARRKKQKPRAAESAGTRTATSVSGRKNYDNRVHDARVSATPVKTIKLIDDQTPVLVKERQRIENSGGYVDGEGRVCGRLAVSRSFGDLPVKRKGVVSTPGITTFTIKSGKDKFMLLACDGLWSVFSADDAVNFVDKEINLAWQWELENPEKPTVLEHLKRKETPLQAVARKACTKLVAEAIEVRKAKDNTSVILVLLDEPFTSPL